MADNKHPVSDVTFAVTTPNSRTTGFQTEFVCLPRISIIYILNIMQMQTMPPAHALTLSDPQNVQSK